MKESGGKQRKRLYGASLLAALGASIVPFLVMFGLVGSHTDTPNYGVWLCATMSGGFIAIWLWMTIKAVMRNGAMALWLFAVTPMVLAWPALMVFVQTVCVDDACD